MALRPLFAPLRPDLDPFLFAMIEEGRNGIPLSTISALTQLGLDPWDEAGRLAGLAKRDAVEQLTGLLLRLPGPRCPLAEEARQIAITLIDVLPPANGITESTTGMRDTRPARTSRDRAFWVICCVLIAAAVLIMLTS
jgi:hypothetical protein